MKFSDVLWMQSFITISVNAFPKTGFWSILYVRHKHVLVSLSTHSQQCFPTVKSFQNAFISQKRPLVHKFWIIQIEYVKKCRELHESDSLDYDEQFSLLFSYKMNKTALQQKTHFPFEINSYHIHKTYPHTQY